MSLGNAFVDSAIGSNSIVQVTTSLGTIDLELYNSQAPNTVQNFLNNVNSGAYNNTLFYKAVASSLIQTGEDYAIDNDGNTITTTSAATDNATQFTGPGFGTSDATIPNEFNSSLSNTSGTIAMAKFGDGDDSSSTDWFINLGDNSQTFDSEQGGYTVFGQLITPTTTTSGTTTSLTVAQAIGNSPTPGTSYGSTGPQEELPLQTTYTGGGFNSANMILVPSVSVISGLTYTVSSSNTNIVNASISGGSVALAYGQAGSATVTVTGTDVFGNTGTSSFAVTVPYDESVGIASSNKPKTVTFTDINGTLTTITLKGAGTINPSFSSSTAVTQTPIKTGTAYSGTGLALANLQLESTNADSTLTITSKYGTGQTSIENFSTGALKSVTAKTTTFSGDFSFAALKSLAIGSASNATISGQVVTTFSIANNSTFTMNLSGSIGTLNTKALLSNTTINATGIKSLSAGALTGDQINVGYSGTGLPSSNSQLTTGSAIGSVKDQGPFSDTDIVADTLGTVALGPVTTDNSGTSFGLGADSIKSLTVQLSGKKKHLSKLTPSNTATAVKTLGALGDFEVDVV
jgi:cyclophilin family peptidyl-prolyl cis-trans isomerase